QAEQRFGIKREEIAARTVFVSHETYTPARGGSASAEIHALRNTFGDHANKVIIANTKGFTGHTMGVGVEDVMAVKALEYGIVPPIAHYDEDFQADPELGDLNLSHGGIYPVEFSLRLGAGFGSQIAMTLIRKVAGVGERVNQQRYMEWLAEVSGYTEPDVEVVQHNYRIKHVGAPKVKPMVSNWQFGQGPQGWATEAPDNIAQIETAIPAVKTTEHNSIVEVAQVSSPLTAFSAQNDEVSKFVLEKVSEKTGYPTEMLDPDLDLEADLGIDTVKQAELFASIRENFGIPRREDLRLSDYNTLAKVMQFVLDAQSQANPEPISKQPASIVETTADVAPVTTLIAVNDDVTSFVLASVSEKTGYPTEMLDLDLDLEADLGIDTVKQAELFASIRENFNIPRREDLRLSDYNTLTKVVQFVLDSQEQVKAETVVEDEPVAVAESSPEPESEAVLKRRIPIAVLRPRLDLCTSTGIVLDKNSRVIVFSDSGKVAPALVKKLQEKEVEVLLIKPSEKSDLITQINDWSSNGDVDGLYFLPTLRKEKSISGMTQADWKNTLETKFFNLVATLRQLQTIKFLVVATRFDGLHGLSTRGPGNPLSGAAAGFAKAIARERNVLVKVVDFSENEKPTSLATKLVEETLFDQAVIEVAWEGNQRFTLVLRDTEIDQTVNNPIPQEAVFIVSGGTGGITAPIVQDLAQHTKGHFYLLARTSLPEKDSPELELLANDPEQLKFAILERLSKSGQKATPAIINQEIAGLERSAATLKTMDAIREAGGQATYLPCDVTNKESINEVVQQILEKEKRVDVLIHAAGVEKSRKLESKSEQEFHQIVDVKATGFFNLFKALETAKSLPKAIVNFGSVAGRFGNSGQTDYSAANDLLSRLSSAFRHQYPEIQVITIDWGAWAEVGMASRGHIPELMRRAGIEMLNPTEAACMVRQELEAGSHGEVILAGSLGLLESQSDPAGGMDVEKANQALTSGQPMHVMLSRASGFNLQDGILLEVDLDPSQEAFLKDHSMNGTPLLPGVMGIEGFSVAAQHIASTLGAAEGGFHVSRLENINFLTPFKFYRNEARRITWKAQVVYEQDGLIAYVTLESDLARVNKKTDHMLHFSGEVHLIPANKPLEKLQSKAPHWNGSYTLQAEDIYKLYFHGPAFQVLEGVQKNGEMVLGKLNRQIPPLMHADKKLVGMPILVELCLQTAGVWDIGKDGSLSLPQSIGALRLFENKVNGLAIFAEVQPVTDSDGNRYFNARVIDSKGQIYLEIDQYRTSLLPYGVEKDLLIPIETLIK
ncbi:MAG TPA: SDR family NAD(P)-dependent oxidoreductase, partial [Anaerolineaceae bacterium]|nr:SDR family NAD(P)-dependent oxidoreductase [Anaerolineaceae bacterium]